jgi:predicted RNA-binding Zn-ribbon protein involved in translation (DUF1610 family)
MIGTKPQSHEFFVAWVASLLALVLCVSVLSNLSIGRSFMKKEMSDHWRPAGIVGAAPGATWSAPTPSFGNLAHPVAFVVPPTQVAPLPAVGVGRPTLFQCPVCGSMRYVRCPLCRERLALDGGHQHLVCPAGHGVPTIPNCPGCGAPMRARQTGP